MSQGNRYQSPENMESPSEKITIQNTNGISAKNSQ